ncbi:hypothetical protein ACFQ7J_21905 [Streptomyces sp. NPDC056501]|uniref:hypothetical protein n=1 Tax=Streptomyces sp. NPDC056501 TaxID=3345841 RepID=UPI0036905E3E
MSAIVPALFRVRVPAPEDGPEYREIRTVPAEAEDIPALAEFRAGVMYSLLRLPAADIARLSRLAGELAAHVAERVLSDTLLLVTDYDRGLATVSVIAPAGQTWKPLDPGSLDHVEPTDRTGVIAHDIGPSAYVLVQVVPS